MSSLFDIIPPPQTVKEIQERWSKCRRCFFSSQYPKGPCVPAGGKRADVLVLGQWPGQDDMQNGVPFSGPQGRVCREMLEETGFVSSELFFTNVLLCSCPLPTPTKEILENCHGQVEEVIAVVRPRLILALGAIAQKRLNIREVAGRRPEYRGIPVAPVTHPAAIARAKSREEKARLEEEIQAALDDARRFYLHGD